MVLKQARTYSIMDPDMAGHTCCGESCGIREEECGEGSMGRHEASIDGHWQYEVLRDEDRVRIMNACRRVLWAKALNFTMIDFCNFS
ncbi:hypothetical protein CASFOL_039980 [Castilleja foliolosa]|uniref:Uncharacterized protein n=1 Tax=Castilleja foliolosa TaxID=1961234 RepID=A0ABD3BGR1_9LAMI